VNPQILRPPWNESVILRSKIPFRWQGIFSATVDVGLSEVDMEVDWHCFQTDLNNKIPKGWDKQRRIGAVTRQMMG
jgi:hypothetical protein